jgi:hypothetical protein
VYAATPIPTQAHISVLQHRSVLQHVFDSTSSSLGCLGPRGCRGPSWLGLPAAAARGPTGPGLGCLSPRTRRVRSEPRHGSAPCASGARRWYCIGTSSGIGMVQLVLYSPHLVRRWYCIGTSSLANLAPQAILATHPCIPRAAGKVLPWYVIEAHWGCRHADCEDMQTCRTVQKAEWILHIHTGNFHGNTTNFQEIGRRFQKAQTYPINVPILLTLTLNVPVLRTYIFTDFRQSSV